MIRMSIFRDKGWISDTTLKELTDSLRKRGAIILQDSGGSLSVADIDVRVYNKGPLDATNYDLVAVIQVPDNDDQRLAHRRNYIELQELIWNQVCQADGDPDYRVRIDVQLQLVNCDSATIASDMGVRLR